MKARICMDYWAGVRIKTEGFAWTRKSPEFGLFCLQQWSPTSL